jgi:hypothetical protein
MAHVTIHIYNRKSNSSYIPQRLERNLDGFLEESLLGFPSFPSGCFRSCCRSTVIVLVSEFLIILMNRFVSFQRFHPHNIDREVCDDCIAILY